MSDYRTLPDSATDTTGYLTLTPAPFDDLAWVDDQNPEIVDADIAESEWLDLSAATGFFEPDSPTFDRWPIAGEMTNAQLLADYGTGDEDQ